MNISRRQFMQTSALVSVPLLTGARVMAQAQSAITDQVIVTIFLRGGADGLSMIPPLFEDRYFDVRPDIAIAETAALPLDTRFAMHPSMTALQPFYNAGEMAVVHATGLTNGTHSHFDAQDFMERGDAAGDQLFDGWLGRYAGQAAGSSAGTFFSVGVGTAIQRSLIGSVTPIGIQSIDSFAINLPGPQDDQLKSLLDTFYAGDSALDIQSRQALTSIEQLSGSGAADIQPDNGAVYAQDDFSQDLQEVARLIKSGSGVRVAAVDIGGWDHHDNANQEMPGLLQTFADGVAAFMTDLGEDMNRVTVVVMSEFGRRVFQNGSGGTDHGFGNMMLVMGKAVNGGRVYTDWPGLSDSDLAFTGDLAITTDYRMVLSEVIGNSLPSADLSAIFPDFAGNQSLGLFA